MAKKVKFLQTSAGDYGLANTGDVLTVTDSVAAALEKNKVVEVVGSAGEDDVSKPEHGGVRISDQTGNQARPAGETNPKNPTGPDKPAPKAGPLKPSKKR